jgi:hypothetical protein
MRHRAQRRRRRDRDRLRIAVDRRYSTPSTDLRRPVGGHPPISTVPAHRTSPKTPLRAPYGVIYEISKSTDHPCPFIGGGRTMESNHPPHDQHPHAKRTPTDQYRDSDGAAPNRDTPPRRSPAPFPTPSGLPEPNEPNTRGKSSPDSHLSALLTMTYSKTRRWRLAPRSSLIGQTNPTAVLRPSAPPRPRAFPDQTNPTETKPSHQRPEIDRVLRMIRR